MQVDTRLFETEPSKDVHDDFMSSLKTRMNEVTQQDSKLPLVVLDSMLPRQVLKITVKNGLLMELVRTRLQEENPFFGMTGLARLKTGQKVHLKSGVEVEIAGKPKVTEAGLQLELKAGRRFRVEGDVEATPNGWTQATVQFLNPSEEDALEWDGDDPMTMARAMQNAKTFTDPNANTQDQAKSLVDTWLELARSKERQPGQIDQLLESLGEIPSWEEPTDCAFWVAALINPIPALGVAKEIRPQILSAKTAEQRTQIALDGILNSIVYMQARNRNNDNFY